MCALGQGPAQADTPADQWDLDSSPAHVYIQFHIHHYNFLLGIRRILINNNDVDCLWWFRVIINDIID